MVIYSFLSLLWVRVCSKLEQQRAHDDAMAQAQRAQADAAEKVRQAREAERYTGTKNVSLCCVVGFVPWLLCC